MNRTESERQEEPAALGWRRAARIGSAAIALVLAMGTTGVHAEPIPWLAPASLSSGGTGLDAFFVDLDGDGDLDVLHANSGLIGNEIAWQENTDGLGSFGPLQSIATTAPVAGGLAIGDLDFDGRPDVVVPTASNFFWVDNPDGGLGPHLITNDDAVAAAVGDVDGDGLLDVAATLGSIAGTNVCENDGTPLVDGWVCAGAAISPVGDGGSLAFGDADADGDLDVFLAETQPGRVTWFENDGTPFVGAWVRSVIDEISPSPTRVDIALADMDRDGDLDVAVASDQPGLVEWWENDGTPAGVGDWARHEVISEITAFMSVQARDMDRDGDVDLLVGAADGTANDNDKVAWYENLDGLGTTWTEHPIDTAILGGAWVYPGDVDGDGDVDVLSASEGDGEVSVYVNDSISRDARFREETSTEHWIDDPVFVVAADLDGDGDPDFASRTNNNFGSTDKMVWQQNLGTSWAAPGTIATSTSGRVQDAAAGDLDGDGDLDLSVVAANPYTFAWYENEVGDASSWILHTLVSNAGTASGTAVGDLDRDGELDIVTTHATSSSVLLFHNQGGASSFDQSTIDGALSGARGPSLADFDGDGDLDVVVSGSVADTLAWYDNDGASPPGFVKRSIAVAIDDARETVTGDFDGDGDVDVAAVARVGNELAWHENDGATPPGFTKRVVATTCTNSLSLTASDLDLDGDLDLVCPDRGGNRVLAYLNDGDGLSWTQQNVPLGDGARALIGAAPRGVATADVDLDGDPDVLAGWSNRVAVHLNLGGQASLDGASLGEPGALDGTTVALLAIDLYHGGRSGDNDVELATLSLLFEESPGVPLSGSTVNALVSSLELYRDDGSGGFDGSDALAQTIATETVSNGQIDAFLSDGDPNLQVTAAQGVARFFVVATFTASASGQSPNTLRVTHLADAGTVVEDAAHDLPLRLGEAVDLDSGFVTLLAPSGDDDGDGLSNSAEIATHGTDPTRADTDDDGMLDGAEITATSDPLDADSDDDGVVDGSEARLGSDPASAASLPAQLPRAPFVERSDLATLDVASQGSIGDIDGDGRLDVAVMLFNGPGLVWYPNNGGDLATWSQSLIDGTVGNPQQGPLLVDIDGDGDIDVASGDALGDSIAWWRNDDGAGLSWTRIDVASLVGNALALEAHDVDVDGDLDFVVVTSPGVEVRWYENDAGDGTSFTPHVIRREPNVLQGGSAGDIDGDGDVDVAWANIDGDLYWSENQSGAEQWTTHYATDIVNYPQDVRLGDMDDDGDLDVVFTNLDLTASGGPPGFDRIAWAENVAGDGSDWTVHFAAEGPHKLRLRAPIDLDRDGDLDVPTSSFFGANYWLENVDRGAAWLLRPLASNVANSADLFAGDLDGDGDIDLVGNESSADTVSWWANETIHRSAAFPERIEISTSEGSARQVRLGDFDGDGDIDVLSGARSPHRLVLFENDGEAIPGFSANVILDDPTPTRPSLAPADIDGDGDLDFVHATSGGSGSVGYYDNTDGLGSFTRRDIDLSFDTWWAEAGDFDGDGDIDVAALDRANELVWYENDRTPADGAWTRRVVTSVFLTSGTTIRVADIDGDGDLDMIAASEDFPPPGGDVDNVRFIVNDGTPADGGWTTFQIDATANGPYRVAPADVDGDGDLDVVVASRLDNVLTWLENDGTPASDDWTKRTVFDPGVQPGTNGMDALDVADLDHDGDLDVVSCTISASAGADLWWHENDGTPLDGGWVTRAIEDGPASCRSISIGDLDGDGDDDFATASFNDDSISWFPNRGGQVALVTSRQDAGAVLDGAILTVLRVDVTHRGRPGDSTAELAQLEFFITDDQDVALSDALLSSFVETIGLYADLDDSGLLDAGDQAVSARGTPFFFGDSGVVTFPFGDDDVRVQVDAGQSRTYFLTLLLSADASTRFAGPLRVTHRIDEALAEDAVYDLPIDVELTGNVVSADLPVLSVGGDFDGDGVNNYDEIAIWRSDPTLADSDGDGLTDGEEVNTYGTSPTAVDTDDDALDDGVEVGLGLDATDEDSDDDGVCDGPIQVGACTSAGPDNCPLVANGGQTNSDALPSGDACQCGDVTGGGIVDAIDLERVREYTVGRTLGGPFDVDRCDVDGDGICGVGDAFVIDRVARGESAAVATSCPAWLGP